MEPTPNPEPAKPAVFNPEDISDIPADIRAQLNIIPASSEPQPGGDDDLSDIPAEVLAKVRALAGQPLSNEEPGGFSWAALVYGPFYYAAMKDWPFVIASALASIFIYTAPLLIPLAFFARKRAWNAKTWESETVYWRVQRQWDRTAILYGIVTIIGLYILFKFIISTLGTALGTTDPSVILQQTQSLYQEE